MADRMITDLTNLAALTSGDIFYCVADPGGSPVDRKVTIDTVVAALGVIGSLSDQQVPRWESSTSKLVNAPLYVSAATATYMGINVAAPDSDLHVWRATAGTITAVTDTVLTIENSGNCYVSVLGGNSSSCGIWFGDDGDADNGGFKYTHAATPILRRYVDGTVVGYETTTGMTIGSDSAAGAKLDVYGNNAVGSATTTYSEAVRMPGRDIDASETSSFYGIYVTSQSNTYEIAAGQTNSGTVAYAFIEGQVADAGFAGTLASQRAAQINFGISSGGGTITACYGTYLVPYCSSGTVTSMFGIRVDTPTAGGTLTTNHGIYIDAITRAAVTNYGLYIGNQAASGATNYSIYSNGGTFYHVGGADFGASLGSGFIDVSGSSTDAASTAYALQLREAVSITSGATAQRQGAVQSELWIGGTNTQNWTASWGAIGLRALVEGRTGAAGTITGMAGIDVSLEWTNSLAVTSAAGIHIGDPAGTGTATNCYGIYIDSQTSGSSTNYSIYSAGGTMYHAGVAGIGGTNSATTQIALEVTGINSMAAATGYAIYARMPGRDIDASESWSCYGLYIIPNTNTYEVAAGQTNSGSVVGIIVPVAVNDAGFAGTLTTQRGATLSPGITAGGGTITVSTGLYIDPRAGAGTITTVNGINIAAPTAGGTVATSYGLNIDANARTCTTAYGISVGAITGGATNYSIYSNGGTMTHLGYAVIGAISSAPGGSLDVYGNNAVGSAGVTTYSSFIRMPGRDIDASETSYFVGEYITTQGNTYEIAAGQTNSGYAVGLFVQNYAADSGFVGTITTQRSILADFGIQSGAGTITDAYGVQVFPRAATGTITNSYGVHIGDHTAGGTVTNQYGLYIASQTRGGTLKYSIYSAGGTMYHAGNVGINTTSFGTNATAELVMANGTAPAGNVTDAFQAYSADIAAGNAAAHFRTENGQIVKLYSQAHITDASTSHALNAVFSDTEVETALNNLGTKINSILTALETNGLLLTS